MNLFNEKEFLGYVYEINPQYAGIYFPSLSDLSKEYGGKSGVNVGDFIIIEGKERGFLARLTETGMHDSHNKTLRSSHEDLRILGKAEFLLTFKLSDPDKAEKTVFAYPSAGAKVYYCPEEQIEKYIQRFAGKTDGDLYAPLGTLVSSNARCNISLNSLFARHCAVIGTTGSGKSWTVSKLIESVISKTNNGIILFDATGEYGMLKSKTLILGEDSYFPYQKLSVSDLFILLRPNGESQKSILLEAVRSLKIMRLSEKTGTFKKAYHQRKEYNAFYKKFVTEIEDNTCNFDINYLVPQIKEESVSYFPEGWGAVDTKLYDQQASMVNKIVNLINTDVFNKLFGFKNAVQNNISIIDAIENFTGSSYGGEKILRINLENVSSLFSAKEITANAIGSYLLDKARNKTFRDSPVLLVVDEAHQFLNKNITDEHFESLTLDAFDLIAKECRKYGLFLCLATQMPRDIPEGTLSQIGSFIVHRIINERDKKVVENAASSAGKNMLSFLPALGEGEVLLVGVDFPMPLLLKIDKPDCPPVYNTPRLNKIL
ncbi:MAG: ATP-binding protein [Endomicrobium sp.]|jgi:ABC-type dipeptide/oligopeptide/nickel transport system ATPase component|nr:ATP-binding protein [Endomicrobium sp.]